MQSKSDCRDTWVAVNVLVALEYEFPNLHALVIGSARYVTEPSLTRGHEGPVAHTVVCGPGLSKRGGSRTESESRTHAERRFGR